MKKIKVNDLLKLFGIHALEDYGNILLDSTYAEYEGSIAVSDGPFLAHYFKHTFVRSWQNIRVNNKVYTLEHTANQKFFVSSGVYRKFKLFIKTSDGKTNVSLAYPEKKSTIGSVAFDPDNDFAMVTIGWDKIALLSKNPKIPMPVDELDANNAIYSPVFTETKEYKADKTVPLTIISNDVSLNDPYIIEDLVKKKVSPYTYKPYQKLKGVESPQGGTVNIDGLNLLIHFKESKPNSVSNINLYTADIDDNDDIDEETEIDIYLPVEDYEKINDIVWKLRRLKNLNDEYHEILTDLQTGNY